jgi:hypothetical protein
VHVLLSTGKGTDPAQYAVVEGAQIEAHASAVCASWRSWRIRIMPIM